MKIKHLIVKMFRIPICRYNDCVNQNYVDMEDELQVTCPKCREYMGLPELPNDWGTFRKVLIGAINEYKK